ncbi:MAG: hypothetical protein WBM01_28695 [Mycobacterium sp.]
MARAIRKLQERQHPNCRAAACTTGRVTTSGIPSARRKLERAKFHADGLRAEIDAFREHSPHQFETKSLGNPRGQSDFRVILKVIQAPTIPHDWAVVTGDILTNVRAALDHAVFPHVRAHAPEVRPWKIQHPIEDTRGKFEAKTAGWSSENVRKVIDEAQPYQFDDPSGHPLRILRELVNIDKHRDLVVSTYAMDAFEVALDDLYEVASPTQVYKREMVPGAVVARAHLRLVKKVHGDHLMQFPCNLVYGETIDIPGIEGPAGLLRAIECVTAMIGPYLDALEAAGC